MKNHSIIHNQQDKIVPGVQKKCPVNATIAVLAGKWKMRILWELRFDIKRFGQLKEAMPGVTPAVLSTQLLTLANEGIITRHVYAEIPPRVEYELTEIGRSLITVICAMESWGVGYVQNSGDSYDNGCLWNEIIMH